MTSLKVTFWGIPVEFPLSGRIILPPLETRAPYVRRAERESGEIEYESGRPNAIVRAIRSAHFVSCKLIDLKVREIPASGFRQKVCGVVGQYGFGREISAHNVLRELVMDRRALFACPLAALEYARRYRDRQLHHDLVVLFTGSGKGCPLCHLVLSNEAGARIATFERISVHHVYDKDTRFLLTVKPLSAP